MRDVVLGIGSLGRHLYLTALPAPTGRRPRDRRSPVGLFDKAKKAAQQAQQAFAQPQHGDGMVHVKGAGPIDTAMFGGPSTRSVAADDPIWQPINGISLQDYAELARDAQARGINDEAGMITPSPRSADGTQQTLRRHSTAGCSGWANRWPSGNSSAGSCY